MERRLRIFDTNIFSSHKNKLTTGDYQKMALSLVVFYELTATKITPRKRQNWETLIREHHADKTLIVPSLEDWHIASRVVWMMHGNNESISISATSLQNDVLICQSAASFSKDPPIIVTQNLKDFSLIADYINRVRPGKSSKLIVQSAREYFKI